jgi:hypothetical protein
MKHIWKKENWSKIDKVKGKLLRSVMPAMPGVKHCQPVIISHFKSTK